MGERPRTIIIEPRLLVREALKSLMGNHSYQVVCAVGSIMDIASSSIIADGPKLVILGAQSTDNALSEAVSARKLWPDSKIILLCEHVSSAEFQKLLTSQIDGCVPLFASPDTLIGTLDMILIGGSRVMVVGDADHPMIQPAPPDKSHRSEIKMEKLQSDDAKQEDVSVSIGTIQHTQPPETLRNHPGLADREVQILDALVQGQSNRMIGRTCDLTEATVKAHMKSILRKIRVENRTQAALWAMQNRYPGGKNRDRVLEAALTMNGADGRQS